MKAAIIGLPQTGKSTLFSAISGLTATLPGVNRIAEGMIPVPDERLNFLTKMYNPRKTTTAAIDCWDIPGLDFSDDQKRRAARQLISQVRTADLFVIAARAFEDATVPVYKERLNPVEDVRDVLEELLLADLELTTTRIEKLEVQVKKASRTQKQEQAELDLQLKLQAALEDYQPLKSLTLSEDEQDIIRPLGYYTLKPIAVVVNVSEKDLERPFDFSSVLADSVPTITLSAKLEQELSCLDEDSKTEFMADLGITDSAAGKFVQSCFAALGLISFLTVGDDEVRAWPIRQGTIARKAAGKVHSDIERGFIRAETMAYNDLFELGSEKAVKAAGKLRLEGKEYEVQDGDIINFRFNI